MSGQDNLSVLPNISMLMFVKLDVSNFGSQNKPSNVCPDKRSIACSQNFKAIQLDRLSLLNVDAIIIRINLTFYIF